METGSGFGDRGRAVIGSSFLAAVMVVVSLAMASSTPAEAQTDNSINDSFDFDLNIDAQSQECNAIVQQFGGASSGTP